MKKIAVFGGSFDPPGLHHRRIVEELRKHFDSVVVVPCGPRPDKPLEDIEPIHRAALADLTFNRLDRVDVELSDLELAQFTPTHELDARFKARDGGTEVWHVIGSDLIKGGAAGRSFIQQTWQRGQDVWRDLNFAVLGRREHEFGSADLPPRSQSIPIGPECHGSSKVLRDLLAERKAVDGLMAPGAVDYVTRHRLYRRNNPVRSINMTLPNPRLIIYCDSYNQKAKAWADKFRRYEVKEDPNCVLVIGGDGTMLRAIQQYWRLRVPFFGINAGHLGYLMNNAAEVVESCFPPPTIVSRPMPLLFVEMLTVGGDDHKFGEEGNPDRPPKWVDGLCFNDAWVERASGQTAWLEVTIDGRKRLERLVCDGLLFATPAGSTAYAKSMGATPLLADTTAWLMVGSNVMQPVHWKSALLPMDAKVHVKNRQRQRRPLEGFMNGQSVGPIREMKVRISRIAAVELAYDPHHDITEKINEGYYRGLEIIPGDHPPAAAGTTGAVSAAEHGKPPPAP